MAITSGYFNSVNGDRKYNADQMSEYFDAIVNQGVFQHYLNGLAVSAGTGLSVSVATGKAIIQSKWVKNDAAVNLTISAASTSYARIDAVVIRLSGSNRTITIAVKDGTPSANPSAPSMTRAGGTYEMALAYVNVAANATSVTVTDKRSDTSVCGWATVAQETSGEVDAMLEAMKTGFDGVVYPSPAAQVIGSDEKVINNLTNLVSDVSTSGLIASEMVMNSTLFASDDYRDIFYNKNMMLGKKCSTGEIEDSSTLDMSHLLVVDPNTTYIFSFDNGAMVVPQRATFFDDGLRFISSTYTFGTETETGLSLKTVDVPAASRYMFVMFAKATQYNYSRIRIQKKYSANLPPYVLQPDVRIPKYDNEIVNFTQSNLLSFNTIEKYEDGYLDLTGVIQPASSVYKEVTSDYIPIKYNNIFNWIYTAETGNALWSRACVFDANKQFIAYINVLPSSEGQTYKKGTIKIIWENARYIRVSYRLGASETNKMYISAALMSDIHTDDLYKLEDIPFSAYPGYLPNQDNAPFTYVDQNSENLEVYTEPIKCKPGDVFDMTLVYEQAHSCWIAVGLYDKNDYQFGRIVLVNETISKINTKYTIPDGKCAYIRFTWRTFGESVVNISSESKIASMFTDSVIVSDKVTSLMRGANTMIKGINHQGYNSIAPGNTLPAFVLSRKYGFEYVETDIRFTSDNVPVLLHDETINRTARNSDGSIISGEIPINSITYQEALTYDFGIAKDVKFAGTKIPSFEQFIVMCKNVGLNAYLDIKIQLSSTQRNILIDILKKYRMMDHVSWLFYDPTFAQDMIAAVPDGRFLIIVSTASESDIDTAISLKNGTNEIVIDAYTISDELIDECIENDIPVEVWTKDTYAEIMNMNSYISGVTSNKLIAGDIRYGSELHKYDMI